MITQILLQILQHTPNWVFVLFTALLAYGVMLSRPRDVPAAVITILPLALGVLSLSRVLGSFGAQPLALLAWLAGTTAAVLLGRALGQPAGAHWSAATRKFHVPGSWVPLALMMLMFFARYALAVTQVMKPALLQSGEFAVAASFAFGLVSGVFIARALGVWATRKAPHDGSALHTAHATLARAPTAA